MVEAPARLLQELIRFDTTNPPGAERECVQHLRGVLEGAGIPCRVIGADPDRPNLVARLAGRGEAPPLLLQGHVDVVTTAGQAWTHPPFSGDLVDGFVWGRGALDMKGGVAMLVSALLRCVREQRPPAGDLLLACLADEEAGGILGAQYLVQSHPELFEGIRHGLGEGGGATQHVGGRAFYPIMVAEKRACRLRATLRGPGGHASRSHRGGTMARLAALLTALDSNRLPVHVTPVVRRYLEEMGRALPEPMRGRLARLADPAESDRVLDELEGDAGRFDSILHHTVNATIVHGGNKINVIPSEVSVDLDGRLLPGFDTRAFISELRGVIGQEVELEILNQGPVMPEPELGEFYDLLAAVLVELDGDAVPVPFMMTGATDQRHFCRLGIKGYGYLPLRLPVGFGQETVHAADERVPASALAFGADALFRVVQRYRG